MRAASAIRCFVDPWIPSSSSNSGHRCYDGAVVDLRRHIGQFTASRNRFSGHMPPLNVHVKRLELGSNALSGPLPPLAHLCG